MVVSHEWRGTFAKQFWMQGTRDESPFLAAAAALQFHKALGVERCRAYSRSLVQWAVQFIIGVGHQCMFVPFSVFAQI
jgi:hypothetical protein